MRPFALQEIQESRFHRRIGTARQSRKSKNYRHPSSQEETGEHCFMSKRGFLPGHTPLVMGLAFHDFVQESKKRVKGQPEPERRMEEMIQGIVNICHKVR